MKYLTDSPRSRIDSLRALKQEVQNTLLLTGKRLEGRLSQSIRPNSNASPLIPSLNLPLPEDVNDAFKDLPLSPQLLAELDRKYRHSLQQIQQLHHQKFEEACQELCQLPQTNGDYPISLLIEGLRKVCESTYADRYLPMMKNQIIALRSKYTQTSTKKIPFNAEYTPLLEKYFEFNAYPSAPDRQILAQKTTMTPRQIEVWFQNHRKRAKENGKVINRMPPNMACKSFPSLEKPAFSAIAGTGTQAESFLISDEEDGAVGEVNATSHEIPDKLSRLDDSIPSHVFPVRFSSGTAIYHFHTDTIFTFPPPIWPRKPSSQPISPPDINFDDFTATFASKLSVRDGASKSKRRSLFRSRTHSPWFFATTVIPSCAPHPALIWTPRLSTPPVQPILISSNNVCLSSASAQPTLVTSLPLSVRQARSSRKAAPFPKRYPSKYHPYSHTSATTPNRLSRVHSVESHTSFQSRVVSIESMPSRTSKPTLIESTASSASWLATLESAPSPASRATSSESTQFSGSRAASVESMTSTGSRVTSIDSTPSFGSRTSSLSSIESPLPTSPILQPQTDDPLAFNSQDFQFVGDMADFDRLLTEGPQLSFGDDLFANKQDATSMFGYPFPFPSSHNTISSFPINYIQTFS